MEESEKGWVGLLIMPSGQPDLFQSPLQYPMDMDVRFRRTRFWPTKAWAKQACEEVLYNLKTSIAVPPDEAIPKKHEPHTLTAVHRRVGLRWADN